MQPLQEHYHCTSYPLWIYKRCCYIYQIPYHLHYTYLFNQMIPCIFTDIYTHILITNKQFLLLIDIPIQDRSQQITIYEVFTLNIPHGNFSAHYDINTKYLGITKDKTMAVELYSTQFQVCQAANRQFCSIPTPFQPLANPTIMYFCSVCKEPSRYNLMMFVANKENFRCKPTNTDITRLSGFLLHHSLHYKKTLHTLRIPTAWLAVPLHQISTYPPDIRLQTWMLMFL